MSKAKIEPINVCARDTGKWTFMRTNLCVTREDGPEPPKLRTARDVSHWLHSVYPKLAGQPTESIFVIAISSSNAPLGVHEAARGGVGSVAVGQAEILRPVICIAAPAFILAHNHPGGSIELSEADKDFTIQIARAALVVGVKLLDHLVLTPDPGNYFSVQERMPDLLAQRRY
jgi:DNA repair protein RadC